MSDTILRADKRNEAARKVRDEGFVPGVIYGTGVEDGMPVKFDELELNKVLKSQGMNPRMTVMLGDEEKNAVIKEVQRDPIKANILHVDLQVIAVDEVIRTTIPLNFEGREDVESRQLLLEVYLFEVEVSGPANIIPDSITIDVNGKEAGDTVTMTDIDIDSRITPITAPDEVLAVVTAPVMETESDDEEDTDVDSIIEVAVFRIIQETLNNIKKHSEATSCSINLSIEQGSLVVKVTDNGNGFNPEDVRKTKKSVDIESGFGLYSMRQRADLLKGTLTIDSEKGTGTTVVLKIPLNEHKNTIREDNSE